MRISEILTKADVLNIAPAIRCGPKVISYAELASTVRRLRDALSQRGVAARSIVAVDAASGWEWIAAMLAVWEADCVFMPETTETLDGSAYWRWRPSSESIVPQRASQARSAGASEALALPPDACYLIPTSGSTGRRRWIVGSRRGLEHYIDWEVGAVAIGQSDVVSQLTPPTFDPVFRDVLAPLFAGATIAVPAARDEVASDGSKMVTWLASEGITIVHSIPTQLRSCVRSAGPADQLRTLRVLLTAGEPLYGFDVQGWKARFGETTTIVNLYGPSETTLAMCAHFVDYRQDTGARVPVGHAIPGAAAIVIDESGEVCPKYIHGEVLIRSRYASHGYWMDPELTAARFVPNPFAPDDPVKVYRSNDVGYIREDGSLVLTGRMDDEYKLRGVRIDLGDIEDRLRQLPAVKDAAVKIIDASYGPPYICAYVVTSAPLGKVRQELRKGPPLQTWPAAWQRIGTLPKTTSGKVDRNALPPPVEFALRSSAADPDLVDAVIGLWLETLPHALEVRRDDPFHTLGGQSIEAAQIVHRIRSTFNCDMPLATFFELQTPERIAGYLTAAGCTRPVATASPLPNRRLESTWVPLTGAQSRFWRWMQGQHDRSRLQFLWAVSLRGEVDPASLREAIIEVIAESDGQWLTFETHAGEPVQRAFSGDVDVPVIRSSGATIDMRTIHADALAWARQPFKFGAEPLVRAKLYVADQDTVVLALVNHVLGSDGWTKRVMLERIRQRYLGDPRPRPRVAFLDHAAAEATSAPTWPTYGRFWRAQLQRLRRPRLPYRRSPFGGIYTSASRGFLLDQRVTSGIRARAVTQGVSIAAVHLFALTTALQKSKGVSLDHILISNAHRYDADLNEVAGCFTDSLVHIPPEMPDGSVDDQVAASNAALLTELEAAIPPYEYLLRSYRPDLDPNDDAWFPVIYAPQPDLMEALRLPLVETVQLPWTLGTCVWPLECYPTFRSDTTSWNIGFAEELFEAAFVEQVALDIEAWLTRYSGGSWDSDR